MDSLKSATGAFFSANPVLGAVLFFGAIILVLVVTTVFRRKCPKCGKYRAGEVVTREKAAATLLSSNRDKSLLTLRCRYCDHEWQATETKSRNRSTSSRTPSPEQARAKIEQIEQALADPNYNVSDSVRRAMLASAEDLKKYL